MEPEETITGALDASVKANGLMNSVNNVKDLYTKAGLCEETKVGMVPANDI